MDRLEELINEFIVEVMDNNATSNYWLDKRIELETLLSQKIAHNSDYAKCEYCGKKNRVVGYCVTDGCTMHDGKHFA